MDLRTLITDEDTNKSLELLREVRDDPEAPRSLRVDAAKDLLDRKHGKAKQFIEQTAKILTLQDTLDSIAARELAYQQAITVTVEEPQPQPQPQPQLAQIDWLEQ